MRRRPVQTIRLRHVAAALLRSVTLDAAEIARDTGLSVDQVRAAVNRLEQSGAIAREPNRSGTIPLWHPVGTGPADVSA